MDQGFNFGIGLIYISLVVAINQFKMGSSTNMNCFCNCNCGVDDEIYRLYFIIMNLWHLQQDQHKELLNIEQIDETEAEAA